MATYSTTFTVRGSGAFPIDMLRYDACFPASERGDWGDWDWADGSRDIKLRKVHDGKNPHLTPRRWESFTWKLLPESIETRKY